MVQAIKILKSKLENYLYSIFDYKEKINEVYAFISALIVGFLAHGYIFLNNITLHDNVYNFYMGGTYTSGRWMLGKLLRLSQIIYDTNYLHYSTPWFLGLVSLVCLGLSSAIIVNLLKIKSRAYSILVGAILVSFPVITSLFGYMFTAGMYSLGTLMGILGVYFVGKTNQVNCWIKIIYTLIGIALQACSIGVYQANIGVITSLTIILFLQSLDLKEDNRFVPVLKMIFYYIFETIAYMMLYFIAAKYFLERIGETFSSYQGIGNVGNVGFWEYLSRIPMAYAEFFSPQPNLSRYMYMGGVRVFYQWSLLLIILFIGIKLFAICKKSIFLGIVYFLALIVFPLSVNIIYVMCDENIHSMMMYGEVMIFILLIYLSNTMAIRWEKIVRICTVVPLIIIVILYGRYANVCYLKADYVQKSATSYFDRMVTRIESTEGYVAGMPVVYVGLWPEVDSNHFLYNEFDDIYISPYDFDTMVNNYNWLNFMKANCGFNPHINDPTLFIGKLEVEKMNAYPSQGSIKVIDGCVVVKLQK